MDVTCYWKINKEDDMTNINSSWKENACVLLVNRRFTAEFIYLFKLNSMDRREIKFCVVTSIWREEF